MPRPILNLLLIGGAVLILGLSWVLKPEPSVRNYRVLPNMADSVAYDAQAPSPVFPDGLTLRTPPMGTISRGNLPLHYEATPADAVRAGQELKNPFTANDGPALSRGAALYASFCQVCHGPGGMGDGPVTRRGVPPPPSLLADNARNMPDGQIFHILTYGRGNMASYAAQLPREDRWKVILHVRSLQRQAALPDTQPEEE